MAKKSNSLYYLGAAALAAYLFRDKLFGKGSSDKQLESSIQTEVDQADAAKPDAVIDTTKTGQTVSQAVEVAKQISQGVKDIKVLIKTPAGKKDLSLSKGRKKPKRRKRKKAKITIGPTESSLTPFTSASSYAANVPGAIKYGY